MTNDPCIPAPYNTGYIRRLLDGCSAANQADAIAHLTHLAARKRALATAESLVNVVATFDRLAKGARLLGVKTADEWNALLAAYAADHSASSVRTVASYLKSFIARAHKTGTCPLVVKRALTPTQAKDELNVVPLTEEERDALLTAAGKHPDRLTAARNQALIWILWDTGFRVSEALALNVGSVVLDGTGGAHLALPEDGMSLKTGPRTIYVMDCVPALKVWLAYHGSLSDPKAALFYARHLGTRMKPVNVNRLLDDVTTGAGLKRSVWPHLFRHTRCTRAAKGDPMRGLAAWGDAEMRNYFGWAPTSDMPAHYSHLAHRDMEERVRADAGADPLAARVRADPLGMLAKLAGMVAAETLEAHDKKRAIDARRNDDDDGTPAPLLTG